MYRHVHECRTGLAPEILWNAKKNLRRWPEFDAGLASVEPSGALEPGNAFALTPKGGPRVRMTVDAVDAPRRFADVAHLFLAKMRTTTEFEDGQDGTRVRVTIEVFGPLAFLWERVLGRKLAAESPEQTEAFVRYAGRSA